MDVLLLEDVVVTHLTQDAETLPKIRNSQDRFAILTFWCFSRA